MIKIAGGILLALFWLWLLSVALAFLPLFLSSLPAIGHALTPEWSTVGVAAFYVIGTLIGLRVLSNPRFDRFRRWLNNGKPSWR